MRCPCAFRLRTLAQTVRRDLGPRYFSCKLPREMALVKCPSAFRIRKLAESLLWGLGPRHLPMWSLQMPCLRGACLKALVPGSFLNQDFARSAPAAGGPSGSCQKDLVPNLYTSVCKDLVEILLQSSSSGSCTKILTILCVGACVRILLLGCSWEVIV